MGIFSFQIKRYYIIVFFFFLSRERERERILKFNGDKIIGRVMAVSSKNCYLYQVTIVIY